MDEWVDIVNEAGLRTGQTAKKSEAHQKGWLHPTVHIWCYSEKGEILLQYRSAKKSTFALKWDVSVAGHIGAGEDPIHAAVREIEEEIGIVVRPQQLQKIGMFKSVHHHENGIIDAELHHTYRLKLDPENHLLVPQEKEVEALKWWSMEVFSRALSNPKTRQEHVPHDPNYLSAVLQAISVDL